MATVLELKDQVEAVSGLLRRLVLARNIRDPLAHLHPDLTGPQIHVVACLAVSGKATAMTELAHRICASAPTMTGIVDRLERQGLVTRIRDEEDRRVVLIGLTDAGREAFRALEVDATEKITGLLSCLTSAERDTFVGLIGRIVDALANAPERDSSSDKPTT